MAENEKKPDAHDPMSVTSILQATQQFAESRANQARGKRTKNQKTEAHRILREISIIKETIGVTERNVLAPEFDAIYACLRELTSKEKEDDL